MKLPSSSTSVVAPDGLHYRNKAGGSPFGDISSLVMSCFKCGSHRQRSQLEFRRLLGAPRLVCSGGCHRTGRPG